MFRSGSCSEIGPKQYMEDEYICVDNLREHIGEDHDFPSPGAFYGVRRTYFLFTLCNFSQLGTIWNILVADGIIL